MPKTFSIKTLGCKLNQYESSLIAHHFLTRGWAAVPFGDEADAVIVNTCTVTDRSDRKCRTLIRQGARSSRWGGVFVTGCLAESSKKEIESMPEVLGTFGNSEKGEMAARIEESIDNAAVSERSSDIDAPLPFLHTRGFLKIQEGCDNNCSYCIVPSVRGRARSRPFREIMYHAEKLIDAGCPELVLSGITIGSYADSGMDLAGLAESLLGLEGNFRVRITSIEPNHVTGKLIELLGHPGICPHLHLPLQSGSDSILSLMNRPYTEKQYLSVVGEVRRASPEIALGTDIIVGFPGESEDDFLRTLGLVDRAGFAYVHQFTFSPRRGTAAASMKPAATQQEIAERGARLREKAFRAALEYRRSFLGKTLQSVVEKDRSGEGFTAVSGNYLKISLENTAEAKALYGGIAAVALDTVAPEGNRGRIIIS